MSNIQPSIATECKYKKYTIKSKDHSCFRLQALDGYSGKFSYYKKDIYAYLLVYII